MDVVVKRARAVAGRIAAPPSKSMAHRAVLCAALAKGTSHLHHLAFSKDISATLGAAGRLCARVTTGENDAVVEGLGRFLPVDAPVDCCESGSTLRFLIPLASLTGQEVTFTGRGRLMERPQSVYKTLYQQQGLRFEQDADRLFVEAMRRLHTTCTDPLQVLAWHEVYVHLELCTDDCEHVADVVDNIVMENS